MQMSKRTTITVLATALFITGLVVFKPENCYSDYIFPVLKKIPLVGFLVAYNFPPKGYHSSMVLLPIDRSIGIGKFRCKYEGRYQMRIKNINSNSLWHSGVGISGQISYSNGDSCFTFSESDSQLLVCSEGYNYHYTPFFAPDDVPLNVDLVLKVQFSGEVKRLLEINPNAVFELYKYPDK